MIHPLGVTMAPQFPPCSASPHGDLPTAVLCKGPLTPQEVDSRWLEYQTRVESLVSWIKQHTILMSDKSFPQNPVELKVGPGRGQSTVSVCSASRAGWFHSPRWFLRSFSHPRHFITSTYTSKKLKSQQKSRRKEG